ncbi:Hpt domain-containing protein [bacterium]|nr:Hpt domain-containing protein [bacterium]
MESINHDLQASYGVIKLLEGSNINSERVFQSLPGVFAIINENNEILRGNETVASCLGVHKEDILRQLFSNLFNKESWNIFSGFLMKLRDLAQPLESTSFELGIKDSDIISGERAYSWNLRRMNVLSKAEGDLIIIIGEDISQLRESQHKLNEIFSSIPLGIFSINSMGKIEEIHSNYLEYLLDDKEFTGKSLREVLFEPTMNSMTSAEKDGVVSLDFVLGQSSTTYDMLEPFFPKQIFYPKVGPKDGGLWLKITYQPVIYNETIKRLLIILEDRSEIVRAQEMRKKARLLEDQSVQRICQLKQIDKNGLHLYISELNNLVIRLQEEKRTDADKKQLFATVHGIKGIARVAGFTFLKTIANDLESEFQNSSLQQTNAEEKKIEELLNEFYNLNALYNAVYKNGESIDAKSGSLNKLRVENNQLGELFSQYNALLNSPSSLNKTFQIDQLFWGLLSHHYTFVHTLEEGLVNQSSATAAALGKKVKIHFNWGNVLVKTPVLSALNECLIHLINNAIDHGIEAPVTRKELDKDPFGHITLFLSVKDSILVCEITDDGTGINSGKIREMAAEKKLKSAMELAEMEESDILQLILHPGFSTADKVSDTSGRGIGMEAVTANLERFRGAIHIDSRIGSGTTFQLSFQLIGRDDLQFIKQCYPLSYFQKAIKDYIDYMVKENDFCIEMNFEEGFEKGIFYGDLVKAVVCFSSFIGNYAGKGRLSIDWRLVTDSHINCSCKIVEPAAVSRSLIQFSAPLQLCRFFIHQDKGSIVEKEGILEIQIPGFFHSKGAPELFIGYSSKINQKQAKSTFKMIKSVAADLDVSVTFSGDKEKVNMLIYPSITKSCEKRVLPYPGITVSSSRKKIQQDLLKGMEQLVTRKRAPIGKI